MRRSPRFVLLLLLSLASIPSAPAATDPRAVTAAAPDIDAYLGAQVAPQRIPGLVAMVVDSKRVLYANAFGQAQVASSIPMRPDHIFRIASMTKPVTSLAAMMLVESGKLGLDDPVAKYLPEFAKRQVIATFDEASGTYTTRPPVRPMTVRHLLTHTSGLGYPFASPVLAKLANGTLEPPAGYPLLHDPGARFSYSESTRVLGRVVEKVSGQPLDDFLRARIFEPLAMKDTSFSTPAGEAARVVTIHRRVDGTLQEQPNAPGAVTSPVQGDGGLNSTAADYAKFMQLFLNRGVTQGGQRLVKATTIAQMMRNPTGRVLVERQPAALPAVTEPFPLGAGVDRFGLGFQITGHPGVPGLRHAGSLSWAGIFNTEFWIDPDAGIAAVLLMQYLPFYDAAAIDALQGFERRVYMALEYEP